MAEALAHAHGQGVFHRDVKPANILINCYGRPLLADFNIAFAGRSAPGPAGQFFGGTLAYMAPEHLVPQRRRPHAPEAVDQRSDVYSLGVVLFQLLTGRLPFKHPVQRKALTAYLRKLAGQHRAGRRVTPAVDRGTRDGGSRHRAAWPLGRRTATRAPPTWPVPWTAAGS